MADILKKKGNEAFKLQEYQTADKLYADAIKLDPQNAVLYSNRAITLIKLEKWQAAIDIVDAGLAQSPDTKTTVKLLWRKGTALTALTDFEQARTVYDKALKLDPRNASVKKSLESLKSLLSSPPATNTSHARRAHSIDQFEVEKRRKTGVENIKIYQVDELPAEFQANSSSELQHKEQQQQHTHKHSFKDFKESKSLRKPQQQDKISKSSSPPILESYPDQPTIHSLSTIVNNRPTTQSLEYVFSIDAAQYSKIFKNGNIDHKMLNFVLDAIIFCLKDDDSLYNQHQAKALLSTLSQVPRFGLVQLFVDKNKLSTVSTLTQNASELQKWL